VAKLKLVHQHEVSALLNTTNFYVSKKSSALAHVMPVAMLFLALRLK